MRAVESVLAQSHRDFEVVVVDDASTDATLTRVMQLHDPRIRLYSNCRNLGQAPNWNRALGLARGRLIKFLCADDVLYPDCVEAMVALFEAHPGLGLVFSQRDVALETPDDPDALAWRAKHRCPHEILGHDLPELNSGPALLRSWLRDGLGRNAVGEPTNVMMSRACLERIGTFNVRLRQRVDMDLWIRAMAFFDVGFVPRPLACYLVRARSVTSANRVTRQSWMDTLWLSEDLLSYDDVRAGWPEFRTLRRRVIRRCARHALGTAMRGDWSKVRALLDYAQLRLRAHDRLAAFGALDDPIPPDETRSEPVGQPRSARA